MISLIHDDDVEYGTPATIEFYLCKSGTVLLRKPATVTRIERHPENILGVFVVELRDETGEDKAPWRFIRVGDRWTCAVPDGHDGFHHMIERICARFDANPNLDPGDYEHVRLVLGLRLTEI